LNVEPFRVQPIRETSYVSLVRFDHPSGIPLPTSYSSHDAAENFRVNIVERGWFKLKYGRREWTLGAGSMFLSRPTEVYGYSHVKYAEPDTCLRGHRLYRSEQLRWYAERVVAARELIDCDPTADHSLWHLSSQVGMSVFLFARLFRELVGMPPHRYLVHRRLCCARDLLRSGMAVTDVCYASGFNNLSHFINSFRAHFGVSPSKLKALSSAPSVRRESRIQ
jgi:AraC-like DNA-binding protein